MFHAPELYWGVNHLFWKMKWGRGERRGKETSKALLEYLGGRGGEHARRNSDLPEDKPYHGGCWEWEPSLHTTLTKVPTRHSPDAFL